MPHKAAFVHTDWQASTHQREQRMSGDLTEHQIELLSRVLQHGGTLASPFGHPGEDSLLEEVLEDIDTLEARRLIRVDRTRGSDEPERITLTPEGYDALGMA